MRLKNLIETGEVQEVQGKVAQTVGGLAYDSRKVRQGDVFFAVPGIYADGHDFVNQAVEQGAVAVVAERGVPVPPEVTWIRVQNVRRTMGQWAGVFYDHPSRSMVLVGVTGTNGKTTVTYLLESIFGAAGIPCGVIGTINYRFHNQTFPAPHTTPESVDLQRLLAEMAQAGVQSMGMEVSSHALDMERVRGIDFDGALFTNLSHDHLDYHGDMDRYFISKSRLFTDYLTESWKAKKFAVIHGADPRGPEILEKVCGSGIDVVSYGCSKEWDVHPVELKNDLNGIRGRIRVKGQELDFSTSLVGTPNLENILGAVGVGMALDLPMDMIAEGIARLDSVPGRLERISNALGITVLVDYAHTPDALEKVLQALGPMSGGRLITLFGCGGDRDRGKRPVMGEIAARNSDLVVLTSDNPRTEDPLQILEEVEEGIQRAGLQRHSGSASSIPDLDQEKGYWVEPDRRAAIGLALSLAHMGDLIIIAGKGHEDYQILGTRRVRFDDREVVREELTRLTA